MRLKFSVLVSVFLISLTGLMFEVLLTRVFSSLLWYHFAFIAISSALLGWGLGALIVTMLDKKHSLLGFFSVMFSLAMLLFLYICIKIPATQSAIPIYYVFAVFPFLFGGMCLSMIFDLYGKHSGRLYFSDLLGASLGALAVPLLLIAINPESLIILVAIIPLLASLFIFEGKKAVPIAFLIAILGAFFAFNMITGAVALPIGPTKALAQHLDSNKDLHIVRTDWNSFSRVDLVEGFGNDFLANNYIDTFAWTYIIPWNKDSMNYTRDWFRYFPYHVKSKADVLIIGSGGGTDVSLALASEAKSVTAVEINPSIIANVRSYGDRAGNIYNNSKVHIYNDEGRNFVSRSDEKFDIVLLGFVDSSSAIASGGLVMSENYLYTVESFEDYLNHLNDDGVLAFVRYEIDIPKLLTISKEALEGIGVKDDIQNHIIVVSQTDPTEIEAFLGNQMVFVIKKSQFTVDEISWIKPIIDTKNWSAVILPYNNIDHPYDQYLLNQMSQKDFESRFDIIVHATHDNNPFYFAYYKPLGIPENYLVTLLLMILISIGLFIVVLIFKKILGQKINLKPSYMLYFTGLGIGFMMMEIPILQKFILLLGRPIYTFSVILFSLLLSTSLGSLASSYYPEKKLIRVVIYSTIIVVLVTTIYLFTLDNIVRLLLPLSLFGRMVMTFMLLFPIGFFIGMPFPSGIRLLKMENQDASLAFGINGLASVFGSIFATVIGVGIGFSTALTISIFAYILVLVCIIYIAARITYS